MDYKRASGILLHVSSLPGEFGIGDLGPQAYKFIDFLRKAACKYWQILPVGPPGLGNSPYQGLSAFAGYTDLISPEVLRRDGYIDKSDLEPGIINCGKVDYGRVFNWKNKLLSKSYIEFKRS